MSVELHDRWQEYFEADAQLKTLLGEEGGKVRVFAGWPQDILEIPCTDTLPGFLVLIESEEAGDEATGEDTLHRVPDLQYEITAVSRDPRLNLQVRDRLRDLVMGKGPIDTTSYTGSTIKWNGSTPLSVLADKYRAALEMRFAVEQIHRKTPIQPGQI